MADRDNIFRLLMQHEGELQAFVGSMLRDRLAPHRFGSARVPSLPLGGKGGYSYHREAWPVKAGKGQVGNPSSRNPRKGHHRFADQV